MRTRYADRLNGALAVGKRVKMCATLHDRASQGATPAFAGVLGIIPGSMGSPGFVVLGLGNVDSDDFVSL